MPDLIPPESWKLDKITGKVICQDCGKIVFMGLCDCLDKYYFPMDKSPEQNHSKLYGYCQCGCGQKTNIININNKKQGLIKGQPRKYIQGHANRKSGILERKNGYRYIRMSNHPRKHKNNMVPEHILMAEKALSKPLPPKVIPHHVNSIKSDNSSGNLVICEDRAYHNLLHRRERALKACGHVNWRKCQFCKKWDDPNNLFISEKYPMCYHPECKNKYKRDKRKNAVRQNQKQL